MDKHFEKEMEDHYPVSGMMQFTYGESANLRSIRNSNQRSVNF